MIPGLRACLVLLALLTGLTLPRLARAEEGEGRDDARDHQISPEGRRFRVRFDPASRVWIGARSALAADAGRLAPGGAAPAPASPGLEIDLGISYRSWLPSGAGVARVVWQVDHRVLAGWVAPLARPVAGTPALDATLYSASLLRHDESPRVVLPMSPPVSVPFPFDIGVEGEVGRLSIPSIPPAGAGGAGGAGGQASVPLIELGVLRASALLDPWRSGLPGRSVEIGVGVRYDLDAYAEPAPASGEGSAGAAPPPSGAGPRALGRPRVIHRIAPMTAGSLRVRLQSSDGLAVLDCRGDVVPHWSSEGRWQIMVRSDAHLERTLIAINDQPIAAVLEGGYRMLPPALDVAALHDLRVSLGLSFALQLR